MTEPLSSTLLITPKTRLALFDSAITDSPVHCQRRNRTGIKIRATKHRAQRLSFHLFCFFMPVVAFFLFRLRYFFPDALFCRGQSPAKGTDEINERCLHTLIAVITERQDYEKKHARARAYASAHGMTIKKKDV